MLTVGVVADADGDAFLPGAVKEAFDLGTDVELVLAAVGDIEIEQAVLDVEAVEHLDGIILTHAGGGVGIASAKKWGNHPAKRHHQHTIKTADDLAVPAIIGSPTPAARVEIG